MNATLHSYAVQACYIKPGLGWITETQECEPGTTMDAAWRLASREAHALDAAHGDSHFWSVTLRSEHGDIVQLFHGRLV